MFHLHLAVLSACPHIRGAACRYREELVRLHQRAPGEATPPGAAAMADGGEAEMTRALGFLEAKKQAGKEIGPGWKASVFGAVRIRA